MDSASDASHAPSPGAAGWQGSGEPTDASIGGMPAVVELLEHLERSHDQPDRTVEKLPSHLQNPDLLAVAENLGVIAIIERVFVPGGRGFDSFAYRVRNPKGNPRSLRTVLEESLKQAHESSKVRIQLTQRGGAFLAQRRLTPRAPKPGPLVGDAPTGATVEDCDAGPPQPHIEKMGGPRVSGTASQVLDDLVTLDQAAATVQQSKRTLERYLQEGKLPRPDFPGGGGKANKWYWSTILPSLRGHFRPDLPDKFPASRVV